MVVVADEYGGTAGVLTLEDILSEAVGSVSPQPGEEAAFTVMEEAILISGRCHVHDLNPALETKLPEDSADTVGGYVLDLFGRLPRAGDAVADNHYRFAVIRMAGRRIASLEMRESIPTAEEQQTP